MIHHRLSTIRSDKKSILRQKLQALLLESFSEEYNKVTTLTMTKEKKIQSQPLQTETKKKE